MSIAQNPSTRARLLTAGCGLAGVAALVISFALNPGIPPDTTAEAAIAFANEHVLAIHMGVWLQGIGSLLNVVFFLAVVDLARARRHFAGQLTLLAGCMILMVSLMETAGYLWAAETASQGALAGAPVALDFVGAVQHVFLIAPAVLLPFGVVLFNSDVLPKIFGAVTVLFGGLMQILGLVGLFTPLQGFIDNVLTVQLLWIAITAVALVYPGSGRSRPAPVANAPTSHEEPPEHSVTDLQWKPTGAPAKNRVPI